MFSEEEASILELQTQLEKKEISSVELIQLYLRRIAKYDKSGPCLNSVAELNPDALFIGAALDAERAKKGSRGLMHGIPVMLKDNIDTGDYMHTTAGSLALKDNYAPRDAHLVTRLREAGAIILGKTNLTEFAHYVSPDMPCGYSSRGGQVKNPYDLTADPSGSSSGSAVAVAASLCAAAVGTQTSGSIYSPAKMNRIVGLKPTVGLISRDGIIPISRSQDSAGPMARSLSDAAILLGAMTGPDLKDPAKLAGTGLSSEEYLRLINNTDIAGIRIGVSMLYYDKFSDDEKYILENAVDILSKKGAVIVRHDKLRQSPDKESSVLLHEFKAGINRYLSEHSITGIKTLTDIIGFNNLHPEAIKYGQGFLEMSDKTSGTLTEIEYITDRLADIEFSRTKGIDRLMDEEKLEALLFLEDAPIADIAGYPVLGLPSGTAGGAPCSLSFIGKPYSEGILLKLAHIYEQATKYRKKPELI